MDQPDGTEAPSGEAPASLRDRILAHLKERIGEVGQHAIISTKSIADHFAVTPVTVSKHLRSLVQEGHIRTKAAGPKGTIITLEAAPKKRGRPAGATRGGVDAPHSARRSSAGYFCPWCGSKVEKDWRYCNRCGHPLPR